VKKMKFICTNCHQPYPEKGTPYRCKACGGVYDLEGSLHFDARLVENEQPGIWRYRNLFGLPDSAPVISLGEGNTPLVWGKVAGQEAAFKCEFLNPSGSFKDRGSATLVSFLRSRGVSEAVEDSSGNAGASFAAYAARGGIRSKVFVPETASGPKRSQIAAYGAEVIPVPGPRTNAAEAVRREAEAGAIYASHAYLPFNTPGYATLAYELAEQLGDRAFSVVIPTGQGGLLLGVWRGFEALIKAGMMQQMPKLVGVQAHSCAPLWALSAYGPAGLQWVSEGQTMAEGIRVRYPVRGDAVVRAVEASGGMFVAVDEEDILFGRDELARQGFYVENTSAVVWKAIQMVKGKVPDPIVAVLTGSGLKNVS
jgi:threonine synthase